MQKLLFHPFSSSLMRLALTGLPFIFLSQTPHIVPPSGFEKLLATARKSFKKFQKIIKKVYDDSALKRICTDISFYQKAKEEKLAVAEQRNLNAKASITNIAMEVENDWRENVRKLAQAHGVSVKRFKPLFTRICCTQRSLPGG